MENDYSTRDESIGYRSGKVSCDASGHIDHFIEWQYKLTPLAYKRLIIELPILLIPTRQGFNDIYGHNTTNFSGNNRTLFETVFSDLKALAPLTHPNPFVFLGISFTQEKTNWFEIGSSQTRDNSRIIINRSIEFPPGFTQVGLGIISCFGEVLREKYPNEDVKLKIEQIGSIVRMIIEGEDGNRELIEKTLEQYELVVTGLKPPELFFSNKEKILELKNEIRIAQVRMANLQDIIEYQKEDIRELRQLFNNSLSSKPNITLSVSPYLNVSSTQYNSQNILSDMSDSLERIKTLIDKKDLEPELIVRLNDLYSFINHTSHSGSADDIRSSIGIRKFKKFLDEALTSGSKINKLINSTSNGIDAIKGLAKKYNSIAEWCGAPVIPKALID